MALEALKGERAVSELAVAYGVHPTMVHQWKKALLEGASDVFERGGRKTAEVEEDTVRDLHAKIGGLAVANDPARGFRGPTGATVPAPMSRKLKPWTGKGGAA